MQLPSQKLLGEIFHIYIDDISNIEYNGNKITFYEDYLEEDGIHYRIKDINIHELAHKCKEWAFDKGFVLKSYKKQGALSGTYHYAIDINDKVSEWLSNTEPEAIFKACEWILTQKDNL